MDGLKNALPAAILVAAGIFVVWVYGLRLKEPKSHVTAEPVVWPPPIKIPSDESAGLDAELRHPSPRQAFLFFLAQFVRYGLLRGMVYGAVVGLIAGGIIGGPYGWWFFGVVGTLYGFAIGAASGLVLGLCDGVVIGVYAGYREFTSKVAPWVNWLAAIFTYFGAVAIANVIFSAGVSVADMYVQLVSVVAAFAAWDSSRRIMRLFRKTYL
jgi:hypothetical protein